ncbi:MAG: hypothetical protein MRY74_08240 [Neomegalonema sp.]|nr:hypothetical protein [Neomegalonema sp.]
MGRWQKARVRGAALAARAAIVTALSASSITALSASSLAHAQEAAKPTPPTAGAPRLGCLHERLPTIVKLRFELAARVGGAAGAEVVRGARSEAFLDVMRSCGFKNEPASVEIATRYWMARASRTVASVAADRAGLNVETLSVALVATTPKANLPSVAEEIMRLGPKSAEGEAGKAVLNALSAYEDVEGKLEDEPKRLAATFVAAEIIMLGLEGGAKPPAPEPAEKADAPKEGAKPE